MTGYEEALTDPSYAGQILVFCYPLIGNYGIDPECANTVTICAAGAVFKRVSRHPSHYRSRGTLPLWLEESNVRGIEGIDTRVARDELARGRHDARRSRPRRERIADAHAALTSIPRHNRSTRPSSSERYRVASDRTEGEVATCASDCSTAAPKRTSPLPRGCRRAKWSMCRSTPRARTCNADPTAWS